MIKPSLEAMGVTYIGFVSVLVVILLALILVILIRDYKKIEI